MAFSGSSQVSTQGPNWVRSTEFAFVGMRILGSPCWYLLSMLAIILYKNLSLSPLQITLIVALKPTSSLLSPYWSQTIYQRPDRLIPNLLVANILRHLPFLFIPWIDSIWLIIAAFGLYMMLSRATIPAWMELFKANLPEELRAQLVGWGTTIDYLGNAVLAIGVGVLLDNHPDVWRWLFCGTAALGLISTLLFMMIPPPQAVSPKPKTKIAPLEILKKPWRQVWQTLRSHRDFTSFQIGFMLGGAGLMIMQPALPQFFVDVLKLSFTEMGIAIAFCKGIGVALTSPLWSRLYQKLTIFQLSALTTFFATLFPFFLLATSFDVTLLYIAYILYGIMQAGSEMSWHMSALIFAKERDSSPFSATNVLTVGLRGCLVPALGALFIPQIGSLGVILLGASFCFLASAHFFKKTLDSKLIKIRSQ